LHDGSCSSILIVILASAEVCWIAIPIPPCAHTLDLDLDLDSRPVLSHDDRGVGADAAFPTCENLDMSILPGCACAAAAAAADSCRMCAGPCGEDDALASARPGGGRGNEERSTGGAVGTGVDAEVLLSAALEPGSRSSVDGTGGGCGMVEGAATVTVASLFVSSGSGGAAVTAAATVPSGMGGVGARAGSGAAMYACMRKRRAGPATVPGLGGMTSCASVMRGEGAARLLVVEVAMHMGWATCESALEEANLNWADREPVMTGSGSGGRRTTIIAVNIVATGTGTSKSGRRSF